MAAARVPTSLRAASCLLACALLACAGCSGLSSDSDRWKSWRVLQLDGSAGMLFSGRVEMELDDRGKDRVLATHATARLFGATVAQSTTRTVFDGETGRTASYEMFSAKRGRRYLFSDDGYTVDKLRPPEGDRSVRESWEVKSHEEFLYPLVDDRPVEVHDYYGMLVKLGGLPLEKPGDEAVIHVATSDGPRRFVVRVAEERTRERSYDDLATGRERTESLRELRLRLTPDDPQSEEGFLDMEGETEVWVEAGSKAPLEISGKVPKVPGRVKLVLAAKE